MRDYRTDEQKFDDICSYNRQNKFTINLKNMKFIKKLFKKQKKEIGGSGETTVHLDKNFEFVGVGFRGAGGFGGGFSNSIQEILKQLPKQIKVGNYDYNLRIDFFDDKVIAGYRNQFEPNRELTVIQHGKSNSLSELLSRLLALVKVNINN
jgi:hypothetical protein